MLYNGVRFTDEQVEKFLSDAGFKPGTPEFYGERERRYCRAGRKWAEYENWQLPKAQRISTSPAEPYDVV